MQKQIISRNKGSRKKARHFSLVLMEVNNLTFGAHFHGVELIMFHSIAKKTSNSAHIHYAHTHEIEWKLSRKKNENKRAIRRMLHLLQFRAFVFTFLCLCFLSALAHVRFYFCAWLRSMFYFYLNENLIKKLLYRWNMQTPKFSIIQFPFFLFACLGSLLVVLHFIAFFPQKYDAHRSIWCARRTS